MGFAAGAVQAFVLRELREVAACWLRLHRAAVSRAGSSGGWSVWAWFVGLGGTRAVGIGDAFCAVLSASGAGVAR